MAGVPGAPGVPLPAGGNPVFQMIQFPANYHANREALLRLNSVPEFWNNQTYRFDQWIILFNGAIANAGWNDDEKINMLAQKMRGNAVGVLSQIRMATADYAQV